MERLAALDSTPGTTARKTRGRKIEGVEKRRGKGGKEVEEDRMNKRRKTRGKEQGEDDQKVSKPIVRSTVTLCTPRPEVFQTFRVEHYS